MCWPPERLEAIEKAHKILDGWVHRFFTGPGPKDVAVHKAAAVPKVAAVPKAIASKAGVSAQARPGPGVGAGTSGQTRVGASTQPRIGASTQTRVGASSQTRAGASSQTRVSMSDQARSEMNMDRRVRQVRKLQVLGRQRPASRSRD